MAEHSAVYHGPETQEQFLADRLKFWAGFTRFTIGMVIFLALLLIAMAIFLV